MREGTQGANKSLTRKGSLELDLKQPSYSNPIQRANMEPSKMGSEQGRDRQSHDREAPYHPYVSNVSTRWG